MCDSYPDVYEEKLVTAKKAHKCYECLREIKPTDQYTIIKGLWEGKWHNFKICQKCIEIRDFLLDVQSIDCLNIGELYENVRESFVYFDEELGSFEVEEPFVLESSEPFLIMLNK
jgi:hypothetical protein